MNVNSKVNPRFCVYGSIFPFSCLNKIKNMKLFSEDEREQMISFYRISKQFFPAKRIKRAKIIGLITVTNYKPKW
jgi:hypothetical protein